jgi:hypothetical protein
MLFTLVTVLFTHLKIEGDGGVEGRAPALWHNIGLVGLVVERKQAIRLRIGLGFS